MPVENVIDDDYDINSHNLELEIIIEQSFSLKTSI